MKRIALFTIVFSLFIFSSLHSFAATLHVSPNGTDSPTCGSITFPCQIIRIAAENAGAGTHIIRVATGNYFQSISIPSISENLTIQGGWDETFTDHSCNPTDTTFFAPQTNLAAYIDVASADNIDIDFECMRFTRALTTGGGLRISAQDAGSTINFSMRNCIVDSHTLNGIGIESSDDTTVNVTVEDTTIMNMHYPSGSPGTASGLRASSWNNGSIKLNLQRNRITNNITDYTGGGLSLNSSDLGSLQATLSNNIIAGNQADVGGGGLNISSNDLAGVIDVTLTNNTIVNNTATNYGGGLLISADNIANSVKLRNNIVWGNSAGVSGDDIDVSENYFPGTLSGLDIDYSIVGDIYTEYPAFPYIDGGHNLSADPTLTSGYLLQAGSPAINSGQCGYSFLVYNRVAPYDDIEGEKRPGFGQLSGCDIGADEYNSLLCFPVKNQQGGMTMICF